MEKNDVIGVIIAFILLVVIPNLYFVWKRRREGW
jgi:hypothetical protein